MTNGNFAPSEASAAKNVRNDLDAELVELPPLDGAEDDEPPSAEIDELDEEPADGGDPFDDTTGEGDPVDEDLSASEEGSWLDDGSPAALEDDAHAPDILATSADSESFLAENDELGVGDEDFGLGAEDNVALVVDSGEEGPSDADEELREADLPALDADEEGEGEESKFFEMAPVAEEDAGDQPFPWDLPAWERVGAPLDVGGVVSCIACGAREVIAARTGALLRVDLEGTATPLGAAGLPNEGISRLSLIGASTWVETDSGIYASNDGGATFSREMGWPHEATSDGLLSAGPARVNGRAGASAVTDLGEAGGTMAAIYSAEENRSWLVWFDVEGEGRTVAETRMEVKDLAWDETRGVVWAAGDFGVIAFQPPRRAFPPAA
jgi:hypothetical protein